MIGRSEELAVLGSLIHQVGAGGRGAIVHGDAGIGKSTLIVAAENQAAEAGFRILRCAGVQSETTAGFAGLHELLHPILHLVHALPSHQRRALSVALGLAEGAEPDRLLIHLAVLSLVEEASSKQRLLLVVEDLQWLDVSTVDVVAFLSRRLSTAPILLLIAARTTARDTAADPLPGAPLLRIELSPLTRQESRDLLRELTVTLSDQLEEQVLVEAAGNPLALEEFSTATSDAFEVRPLALSGGLPTTRRLEQAFLGTVATLPPASRRMLLLAATTHDTRMSELLSAGRALGVSPRDLDLVEHAGLVTVNGDRLTFRHPLVRSAVYGAATISERSEAHRALAGVATDASRAAWHLASASYEHDEKIAAQLESVSDDARRQGAQPEAVAALHRAATLSPDVQERARRLAGAAEIARRSGATTTAVQLVIEALTVASDPGVIVELRTTQLLLSVTAGTPGPTSEAVLDIARDLGGPEGDEYRQERIALLWCAAILCYGRAQPLAERLAVEAELVELTADTRDPMQLMALALLDPPRRAAEVRPHLPSLAASLAHDVLGLQILALTAESLHDLPRALHCWSAAAELARRTGFPSDECQALRGRANVELMLGRVAAALGDIERALQLVEDQGLPNTAATTMAVAARVMAWQGNSQGADSALARSRELSGSSPLALVTADQAWAAGVIALTEQRFIDALTELAHVCDHPTAALWAVADLTEAAVRAGRPGSAAAALDAAERANTRLGSDHLALLILRSRALLDDGPRAEEHFRAAIDIATAVDAPLEIGRTQLLYGEWLRRHRKPLVAREHLSGALSALESAGAHAQASRAAAELRAAGIVPNRRMPQTRTKEGSALTPQELQIARLAARGLTNKQIADQVYLSHRTVSTHLYRVYPKLGITGRQQLRDALTSLETGDLSPERRAS